jgi:hypothetical protein
MSRLNGLNSLNGFKGAHVAQSVEHILGKDEVTGSIPVMGSMEVNIKREKVKSYLRQDK